MKTNSFGALTLTLLSLAAIQTAYAVENSGGGGGRVVSRPGPIVTRPPTGIVVRPPVVVHPPTPVGIVVRPPIGVRPPVGIRPPVGVIGIVRPPVGIRPPVGVIGIVRPPVGIRPPVGVIGIVRPPIGIRPPIGVRPPIGIIVRPPRPIGIVVRPPQWPCRPPIVIGYPQPPIVIVEPYPVDFPVPQGTTVYNLQCILKEGMRGQDLYAVNVDLIPTAEDRFQMFGMFAKTDGTQQNLNTEAMGVLGDTVDLKLPEKDGVFLEKVQDEAGNQYLQGMMSLLGASDNKELACQLSIVQE